MKNVVFLIGRLTDNPEIKKEEKDKKYGVINLAVQRDYKNSDSVYETDFIRCVLWNGIAKQVKEYCHKGDLVGIKGRIQNRSYELDDEIKYITEVIVDKVSFLASKKIDDLEDN